MVLPNSDFQHVRWRLGVKTSPFSSSSRDMIAARGLAPVSYALKATIVKVQRKRSKVFIKGIVKRITEEN